MRAREKRIVADGKGVERRGLAGTGRVGYENGIDAVVNDRRPTSRDMEAARRKAQKIREANSSPEKQAEQKKKNEQIKARLRFEMMNARKKPQDYDRGAMLDWANEYIPVDDEQQKEYTRMRIRNAFRKRSKEE